MKAGAILLALALFLFPATLAAQAPHYELKLDDRDPMRVDFSLVDPSAGEARLALPPSKEALLVSAPACGAKPLVRTGPGRWTRPAGCASVSWSARLDDADKGMDSTRPPPGAWSRRHLLWLLTGQLPWLKSGRPWPAPISVSARLGGRRLSKSAEIRPAAPFYLAVGQPVRFYRADGFTMRVYGDAPKGERADRLQRLVAATLARWHRDVVPARVTPPDHLDVAWVKAPAGAEAGFFASASSDAVLMQYVPDPDAADPGAKLEAGLLLTGLHEGFHTLEEWIGGGRRAWIAESWATFFAWEAGRRHLKGAPLAEAAGFVDAPADTPILQAEREVEKDDQTHYDLFYNKGTRFWEAIEAVLDGPANGSGRLSALIRATDGMKGLDWDDAGRIAAFLDARSHGRAGPIVRCYLVETGCPEAKAVPGAP
ncbi:MAG TPA: hypothetical protein VFW19_07940 [Allosphingosinicella sp.]|nr:hypothetical protein [Allosphingosinicella sp.]